MEKIKTNENKHMKILSIILVCLYVVALTGFIIYLYEYHNNGQVDNAVVYFNMLSLLAVVVVSSIKQSSLLVGKVYSITHDWISACAAILSVAALVTRVICGRTDISFILYTFTIAGTTFLFLTRKILVVNAKEQRRNGLSAVIVIYGMLSVVLIVYVVLFMEALLKRLDYSGETINNVMVLLAAVLGGGLTLAGVAWTIRNTLAEHNEQLRLNCCPYISILPLENKLMDDIEFEGNSSGLVAKTFVNSFRVRLSRNADCIIKGIFVNKQFRLVKNEKMSAAETAFNIGTINMKESIKIESVSIVATDILQNWYEYSCKIVQIDAEQKDNRVYSVQSIGLPVLMSKNAVKQLNDSLNTKNNTNRG